MNDLPIHITAHHLRLTEKLHRFVLEKIGPLKRFATDALGAEIVLRGDGPPTGRFSAAARISLPGRDVHGHSTDATIYGAIQNLAAKIARLSRRRKTRRARTLTHGRRTSASGLT